MPRYIYNNYTLSDQLHSFIKQSSPDYYVTITFNSPNRLIRSKEKQAICAYFHKFNRYLYGTSYIKNCLYTSGIAIREENSNKQGHYHLLLKFHASMHSDRLEKVEILHHKASERTKAIGQTDIQKIDQSTINNLISYNLKQLHLDSRNSLYFISQEGLIGDVPNQTELFIPY